MIHIVKRGETLAGISLDYRTPMETIIATNRLVNPNLLFVGQKIEIPGIPEPSSIPFQIFVSLGSRRLTLMKNGQVVKVYPIAIGQMLKSTPVGEFVIVNRAPNPGGPFGAMWLSLSKIHYGIHGTNNPSSIGKAVSKGCIRMFNQDVLELSSQVPNGTKVYIRPN
ncbi:L,D-transpeptidase family protein [Metabacillus herbersteinensis]|uniref:L,D-transpeptidase family protein n=1 Tax=Metabacillus herbersteinensis TaxID=283816 RepID=A0ABV6GAK1_9BACI